MSVFVVILSAITTFVATAIDELVVLTIIFAVIKDKDDIKKVYLGQQLGMLVILGISLLAVFGITLLPRSYIGLLGLIPIVQGLRIFIIGDDDDDDYDKNDIIKKIGRFGNLTLSVSIIAIAGAAEELVIYIPYFSSLNNYNLWLTILIFNLLVPVWVSICRRLASHKNIQEIIEKYERFLIPIVLIVIGVFVLVENNTVEMLIGLFH